MIPVGHIGMRFLREERLEALDGLLVTEDPYTVTVPMLVGHVEVRGSGIGVCLQLPLELARCVVDSVVHHADDRIGGPNQVGPASYLRFTGSLVPNDGSPGSGVGPDLVGPGHAAQTDLAHTGAGGVSDLVDPEDVTNFLGEFARLEFLHVGARLGQSILRVSNADRFGRVRLAMSHSHTQHTHRIFLKEIPDLLIALELVVVRRADKRGCSGVDRDQGAADRGDRDHEIGDPAASLVRQRVGPAPLIRYPHQAYPGLPEHLLQRFYGLVRGVCFERTRPKDW